MVLLPRPIDDGVIGAYGNVATVGIDPYVPQELRDTDGYLGPTNAVEAENASADAIAVAFGTHRVDPIRAGAIDAEKALLALMHDARSDAIEMQNHMHISSSISPTMNTLSAEAPQTAFRLAVVGDGTMDQAVPSKWRRSEERRVGKE